VLSGRGLCDQLATRPEESYRMWCVVVCDLEPSRMRSHTHASVIELNRRCITWFISYMPLVVTVKHDCWMSSDRWQCSGRLIYKIVKTAEKQHESTNREIIVWLFSLHNTAITKRIWVKTGVISNCLFVCALVCALDNVYKVILFW
jgi:hypothetical protein